MAKGNPLNFQYFTGFIIIPVLRIYFNLVFFDLKIYVLSNYKAILKSIF